ncbi:multidrug effflux MFS transporter [Nocardioides daphniae]|uniref:MFS transporter n=1 Tax=Nocardioides daphniae TaxID=402297 RepID=A0ABQ1QAB1_9ACTN|nr:multidrug effflux MFS transporter [Nocardioides daphniae]GGD20874.1 MFS transporter [Nocardioides daphniae]
MTSRALDPTSRRALVVVPVILALLSMIGPFSIDTPFPAFSAMGRELDASTTQLQLVVTCYMAAFAVMSIFHGPLSDAVGRRPVLIGGLAVYVVGSIGAAFSPDLTTLLAFRVLQGLSAGAATIVSRTVIRDVFSGAQAQLLMSRVAMIFGLAPAIAPVVGGAVLQLGSWEWVFGFMAVLGLFLIAAAVLVLPETHPPSRRTPLRPVEIVRGLAMVFRIPAFHRVAWSGTLLFGAQFLYIGGAAIFVGELLGLGELDFWVLFVPMIVAMTSGSWISGRAAGRISGRRLVSGGFTVALAGGALGVALTASPWGDRAPWAVLGCAVVALGSAMAYPTLQLMALDLLPERRGAVMSGSTFVTLLFNATVAALLAPLLVTSTLAFAIASLVFVVLGQLCWSWHLAVEDRLVEARVDPDHEAPEELEPTDSM